MRFPWQRKTNANLSVTQDITDVEGKAVPAGVTDIAALVPTRANSVMGLIRESVTGAWQKGFTVNNRRAVMAFSAVYRCVTCISQDISKLRIRLVENIDNIWTEVDRNSPYWQVLRKPNNYQNRIQFFSAWMISKLMYGNTYVLKVRDQRGIVTQMHVLDPRRVTPLVATNGDVYYQLGNDDLARVAEAANGGIVVPALEIIHDRGATLFHPLVGISPLFACAIAATQGNKIQENSAVFFENMSRPSGILTSPLTIKDEVAKAYKQRWEENYANGGMGKIAVLGDQLKYEALAMTPVDADLVKQLDWTVVDVARAFGVPLYKIGVKDAGATNNVEGRQQEYYDDCLQIYIESIELCLDEGLALDQVQGKVYGSEFDLNGLMRMDSKGMAEYLDKIVSAGVMTPNEGRAIINLKKVAGGDTPYMQQQNFSLSALAKRDAKEDPFKTGDTPTPAPAASTPAPAANEDAQAAKTAEMIAKIEGQVASMNTQFSVFMERITSAVATLLLPAPVAKTLKEAPPVVDEEALELKVLVDVFGHLTDLLDAEVANGSST